MTTPEHTEHIEAAETIRLLLARVEALTAERDTAREEYWSATRLVVAMHLAAMGACVGPVLGVVEDVAKVRNERDAAIKLAADRMVDAERYRWLRESRWEMFNDHWLKAVGIYGDGPGEMNAVIDWFITKRDAS